MGKQTPPALTTHQVEGHLVANVWLLACHSCDWAAAAADGTEDRAIANHAALGHGAFAETHP